MSVAALDALAQRIVLLFCCARNVRGVTRDEMGWPIASSLAGYELPLFRPSTFEAIYRLRQGCRAKPTALHTTRSPRRSVRPRKTPSNPSRPRFKK